MACRSLLFDMEVPQETVLSTLENCKPQKYPLLCDMEVPYERALSTLKNYKPQE